MKAALFLVALIAVCSATSLFTQFPMDFSKRRSILAVMTQVESQLKTGGPMDAITRALDEFKEAIETEQNTHDRLKEKQDKECDDEFKLREAAVAESTAALKESAETLDGCKAQKIRADGDLQITKKQLSDNQQFLINAITARNKEHYDFETLAERHQKIVEAIDSAIQYIQEFSNADNRGASFVQLAKHANQMIVMAVQLRTVQHFGASLSALAQLGNMQEVDDAFVEELKNIFRAFKQHSITEFQERADRESAAQKAFDEEKARFESTIEHLKSQKVNLESELGQLNKCIVIQTGIIADATQKKNRNAKLLEDAKAVCSAFEREYVQASAARKEELQLLAAIRVKVEERFRQLEGKDSVQSRGRQDAFDSHVNVAAPDGAKFNRQDQVVL